jgi:SAM-dependent methyltransferase
VCDAQYLPFANAGFDTLVSFEVIEHIPNVRQYLEEIKRVCAPKSLAIISTPNRLLRLLPFQKPWNRFHLREYDVPGLRGELSAIFHQVQILGITAIPAILDIEKQRVKQNPFIAYPKMLAQTLLPGLVYDRLRDAATRLEARRADVPVDDYRNRFSLDDFSVSEQAVDKWINLVAVCRLP